MATVTIRTKNVSVYLPTICSLVKKQKNLLVSIYTSQDEAVVRVKFPEINFENFENYKKFLEKISVLYQEEVS